MNHRNIMIGFPICMTLGMVAGCPGDDGDGAIEPPCKWFFDPKECFEKMGESNDEVGDGDGDETGDETGDGDGDEADDGHEELSDACAVRSDKRLRTVFQCNGKLSASIAFNTFLGDCGTTLGDPSWCRESHEFGFDVEPYEMPAVMACCDAEGSPEDEVLRVCAVDMVEQVCVSIPERIQALLDDGLIKVGKKQARRLRDWLKNNAQQCYDALNRQSDVPGRLNKATWLVNGGNNRGWRALDDFSVTIEEAEVTTATLPDDENDRLSCFDNAFNNSEFFEGDVPPSPGVNTVTRLAHGPDASLRGPLQPDGPVFGKAKLASHARLCQEPWCSSMELTEGAPGVAAWTLEELELFADGPVSVEYGKRQVTVDRGALRLYGVSRGHSKSGLYVIEPGDAHFVLSGAADQVPGTRSATNTTPITVQASGDGWRMDSFTVAHVDDAGDVWKVTVPATTWE